MNEITKREYKGTNFSLCIGTTFPNATFCEIERLAKELGVRNTQVVRDLVIRGLAAYHRDGQLREEPNGNSVPVRSGFAPGNANQSEADALRS